MLLFHKGKDWEDAQRACYIALRAAGWVIRPNRLATGYFTAVKPEREESVTAKDFRELLTLAGRKDAAWREKQRRKPRVTL